VADNADLGGPLFIDRLELSPANNIDMHGLEEGRPRPHHLDRTSGCPVTDLESHLPQGNHTLHLGHGFADEVEIRVGQPVLKHVTPLFARVIAALWPD